MNSYTLTASLEPDLVAINFSSVVGLENKSSCSFKSYPKCAHKKVFLKSFDYKNPIFQN